MLRLFLYHRKWRGSFALEKSFECDRNFKNVMT